MQAVLIASALYAVVKAALVYYLNFPNEFSSIKSVLIFYSFGAALADLVILYVARDASARERVAFSMHVSFF